LRILSRLVFIASFGPAFPIIQALSQIGLVGVFDKFPVASRRFLGSSGDRGA